MSSERALSDDGRTASAPVFRRGGVFGGVDVYIVYKSSRVYRTIHPGPVLEIRKGAAWRGLGSTMYWNLLALACLAQSCDGPDAPGRLSREIDAYAVKAHAYDRRMTYGDRNSGTFFWVPGGMG